MTPLVEDTLEGLLRDLSLHYRSPSAALVYRLIWSRTDGLGFVEVSLQRMAEMTGLSKSAVQSAVRILTRHKFIRATKPTATSTPEYRVVKPRRRK